jgi:hypothetical protein
MTLRRLWPRLVAPGLLLAALVCFMLPWIEVSADARVARATGLELVRGHASYSGYYVHDAWRGEVEAVVNDAHLWSLVAFVTIAAALVLAVVPLRASWWACLGVSGLGLVFLLLWMQATSTVYNPPVVHRAGGFWITLAFLPLVVVPIVARLREPAGDPTLRQPPEWLARQRRF